MTTSTMNDRFDRVEFDRVKKTRILRFLNTYSHSGGISESEHDSSLLAETQPVLADLLDMMKAVDPTHFAGLMKLVEEHPVNDAAPVADGAQAPA